jgi:hypothetical protein
VGYLLPGHKTVPEQIAADKAPYYAALEAADAAHEAGALDLSALEALLGSQLAEQLLSAYQDAHDPDAGGDKLRKLH